MGKDNLNAFVKSVWLLRPGPTLAIRAQSSQMERDADGE